MMKNLYDIRIQSNKLTRTKAGGLKTTHRRTDSAAQILMYSEKNSLRPNREEETEKERDRGKSYKILSRRDTS